MQHHHSASLTSDHEDEDDGHHDDHGDPHDESHHSDHHDDGHHDNNSLDNGHHDNKASEHGFESLSYNLQGHREAQGAGEHSKLDAVLSQLQNRITDPGETADQINSA